MMKTRILIILTAICFGFIFPETMSVKANEGDDVRVQTSELPSNSYLKNRKASNILSAEGGTLSAKVRSVIHSSDKWSDLNLGTITDWSVAQNVGAPIEGKSLPIALSILLLYLLYRRVTISKRRNDL